MTPGHAVNLFDPSRAMGAGVDGVPTGTIDNVYTSTNIGHMLSAGFGPVTNRLYTELSVQDWHWNPAGTFSAGSHGYWTSSTQLGSPIVHTHGYNLPRSGFTTDQGTNIGYSRADDGDPSTFWKSNPYLTHAFTGEPDSSHPQWLVVDLGKSLPVDAIQLSWAQPYATAYQVQYWTGDDAIYDQGNGAWVTFPSGALTQQTGGIITLRLATAPVTVEYVRVYMTAPSGTCAAAPAAGQASEPRDCMGYAVNELGIGTLDENGAFIDRMVHAPNQGQTLMYCSSVDPWHTADDQESGEEQPGLDLLFTSGITRGIPPIIPVTMLYGTPGDSANEIAYAESRGYVIGYVEAGEEPDGQYILPEDYAALYLQWARALHAVDPNLKLGGPVLQADLEVTVWPDASGNVSWLNRFLNYLKAHHAMNELAFMSYEHYPYIPCLFDWDSLLGEPSYTQQSLATWKNDGLPPSVPVFVTESNASWDYEEHQVGLFGALWFADFTGAFLTAGGQQVYYYEYEPLPLFSASECNSWGNFGMFEATANSQILGYTSQYFSARLLTQEWAEPVSATHFVYPANTNLLAGNGEALVTSYAVLRPDGKWSLMLINKDQTSGHSVTVAFSNAGTSHYFTGSVDTVTLSPSQFYWHPEDANGFALPDGPLAASSAPGGANASYLLPPASITVLRGDVQ